jgi:hypothetical protein
LKKPKADELITLAQAAEIYGFSVKYLGNLAPRGRLECKKLGYFWVTTPKAMEEFIKSRRVRGVYKKEIKIK